MHGCASSEGSIKPIPSHSSGGGAGGGKDSHSRQWRLSMAVFLNRNKRPSAAPIESRMLLLEKPPPPEFPVLILPMEGRGGSVSRRDYNQACWRSHPLSGGTNSIESSHPERQLLFGRGGLGERRFSLEKRPLPRICPRIILHFPIVSAWISARRGRPCCRLRSERRGSGLGGSRLELLRGRCSAAAHACRIVRARFRSCTTVP